MTFTTNIQWKGTDLCMDFICPSCDDQTHFDGFFAYAIQCGHCGAFFEMPTDIPLKRLDAEPKCAYLTGDAMGKGK